MIDGLGLELLSAVIAFAAGVAVRSVVEYIRSTRPGRRLWRLASDNGSVSVAIVVTSGRVRDDAERTETIYPAEARAAAEIESYLRSIYRKMGIRVFTSETVDANSLKQNVIVIGGPAHNQISRRFFEKLSPPLYFCGHELVSKDGQTWGCRGDENGFVKDVGLVLLADNPFSRSGRLVLLAGCRTYGCLAAARSMMRGDVRTTIQAIGGNSKKLAFAVASEVHGFEVFPPKVIRPSIRPIESSEGS